MIIIAGAVVGTRAALSAERGFVVARSRLKGRSAAMSGS